MYRIPGIDRYGGKRKIAFATLVATSSLALTFIANAIDYRTYTLGFSYVEVTPPEKMLDIFSVANDPLSNLRFPGSIIGSVEFRIDSERAYSNLETNQITKLRQPNSYWIRSDGPNIVVSASDRQGLLYGADHLAGLLAQTGGRINALDIVEGPAHETRALQLVIRSLTVGEIRSLIDKARLARFNTLTFFLSDAIKMDSEAVIARSDALSKDEIRNILAYTNANGFDVIPEVTLLTHQKKHFFKTSHPDLMYNSDTYDPRNPETYELVFEYLEELIDLFEPNAIHISHDEVLGVHFRDYKADEYRVPEEYRINNPMLPPELFYQDIVKLYSFLKKRGVKTWMWGDMLLAPKDLPNMNARFLNGSGGYSDLLPQLPKDIVICDWHYSEYGPEFPSAKLITDAGHPVLGATWQNIGTSRLFSKYVAHLPKNNRGMIATTWFHPLRNPDDPDIVDKIVVESGKAFWQAN